MKEEIIGLKKDAVFHLKENRLVRAAAYPVCTIKRRLQTQEYLRSDRSRKMKHWKNAFCGQRCFIIGNGPSLRTEDLNRLEGEITFSSNRIYHIYEKTDWRPHFYVAFEPEFCRTNADFISRVEVKQARFLNQCAWSPAREADNTFWMNCSSRYTLEKLTTKNIEFSSDIAVQVCDAYSVTYTILQIALYMGFQEIYLLGVDHYASDGKQKSSHFYEDKKSEYRTPTYLAGIEYGYKLARQEAKKKGVHIYNATRGGNLQVFRRADFDAVLHEESARLLGKKK